MALNEWIEVEPVSKWVKFENPDDQIEGVVIDIRDMKNMQGVDCKVWVLDNQQGQHYVGSRAKLDFLMQEIAVGDYIKIVYLGKKKSTKSQNFLKDFQVFKKDGLKNSNAALQRLIG